MDDIDSHRHRLITINNEYRNKQIYYNVLSMAISILTINAVGYGTVIVNDVYPSLLLSLGMIIFILLFHKHGHNCHVFVVYSCLIVLIVMMFVKSHDNDYSSVNVIMPINATGNCSGCYPPYGNPWFKNNIWYQYSCGGYSKCPNGSNCSSTIPKICPIKEF